MIKEIEVGGVKHSITLADDMVGQGLVKDEKGVVGLKILEENRNLAIMTGLMFTGGALCLSRDLVASQLAGTGLEASGGKLSLSTEDRAFLQGLAYNVAGSGLYADGYRLTLSFSDSGYLMFANDWSLSVDKLKLSYGLCGSGLIVDSGRLGVHVGSGLMLNYEDGKLMIDYMNLFDSDSLRIIQGPVSSVGVKVTSGLEIYPGNGLKVKIAERSSGLRLILNDNGELDVTQD